MKKILLTFVVAAFLAGANAQEVKYIKSPEFKNQIYLYGKPDSTETEQWYEIEGRGQFVRNVKNPALIPYLPSKRKANGAAVIIAPGGAFLHHTFGSGGFEAAEWFKKQGFAAFVLKYRTEETPRDEAEHRAFVAEKMAGYRMGGLSGNYAPPTPDFAYEDICAAVKLVRDRAAEFNVQSDKIGIVGFSAGAFCLPFTMRNLRLMKTVRILSVLKCEFAFFKFSKQPQVLITF